MGNRWDGFDMGSNVKRILSEHNVDDGFKVDARCQEGEEKKIPMMRWVRISRNAAVKRNSQRYF